MEEVPTKKHTVKVIILLIILLIILVLLWARYISTSGLIIKEYSITNDTIPESFHGLKIIQFADVHYGRVVNKREIKSIVTTINSYKPDIVVFTGDLVDRDALLKDNEVEELGKILKSINPSLMKIAVKGNHDYDKKYFDKAMEIGEFKVLNNDYQDIYYKDETPITIIGIPSMIKEKYSTEKLLSLNEKNNFKITLVHEPDTIIKLDDLNFNVMMAGHSHGGQIRLPFYGAVVTAVGSKTYYDEYYKVGDKDLYISSGLGTSQYNFRFLNKPSFNLFRIYNH